MDMVDQGELFARAEAYAQAIGHSLLSKETLGHGMDGSVWRSSRPSAIKALRDSRIFDNELECYRRLSEAGVRDLCGFAVPWLFGADRRLQVIEMSIVQPPYLLDFGKVYFGEPTEVYDRRQLAASQSEFKALFGPRWPEVSVLLHTLKDRFGIWYVDPKPNNIDCGDFEDPDWDKEPGVDYSAYDLE